MTIAGRIAALMPFLSCLSCGGAEAPKPSASTPPATATTLAAVPITPGEPAAGAGASIWGEDPGIVVPPECEDLMEVHIAYAEAKKASLPPNRVAPPYDREKIRAGHRLSVARDGYDKAAEQCKQSADYIRARMPGTRP